MQTWAQIASRCRRTLKGSTIVRKSTVPHPRKVRGFVRSLGLPEGEIANWRKELPGGECLHVKEYPRHFSAHVDLFHPHSQPLEHLIGDVLT